MTLIMIYKGTFSPDEFSTGAEIFPLPPHTEHGVDSSPGLTVIFESTPLPLHSMHVFMIIFFEG